MIIDELTLDDVMMVLEHVQSACAVKADCVGCRYTGELNACVLAHLPERWKLDQIGKGGDQYDSCE